MQITQINASYKPAYIYGGPTLSVSKLCETLCDNLSSSDDLEVVTTTANGIRELDTSTHKIIEIEGVLVRYFPRITKDPTHFSPSLLSYLWKKLTSKNKTQIVHVHAWWNFTSLLSVLIAVWKNTPVILSPRGMLTAYTLQGRNSFYKKFIHRIIGKSLLKQVHIHATTEKEKEDILEIITPKSIEIIPNIVHFPNQTEIIEFDKKPIELDKNKSFKLIFLSRIEEKKGLEFLFDALSKLNFSWNLTIAGTGDLSYIIALKKLAEQHSIGKYIKWVGQINNEDKFQLLAAHDLLCLTSYNENFANVVIESLSVGTAVLISNGVGLASYIKNNHLGWICTLEPKDIAEKITTAKNASLERSEIKIKGPEILHSDYNPTNLANKYINFYKRILNN